MNRGSGRQQCPHGAAVCAKQDGDRRPRGDFQEPGLGGGGGTGAEAGAPPSRKPGPPRERAFRPDDTGELRVL